MSSQNAPRCIEPLRWPADAELTLPGSKSEANRALVAAALCGRNVRVFGATPCDDVLHLIAGLSQLGFAARYENEARGIVHVGPRSAEPPSARQLFCGNSGTALRFLVSVAAITPGDWTITGDANMQRRPVGPLVAAWRDLGISIVDTQGFPPVHVRGGHATGGRVTLDASISSQFLSSLLLVAGSLDSGLEVTLSGPLASPEYARLTGDVLQRFGVDATLHDGGAVARRGIGQATTEFEVGGDWSAMGVWRCLEFLTGSRVRPTNLRAGSGQADEALGAVLAGLAGPRDRTIDVSPMPDQFLNLAIVAALRPGRTQLLGAANLRHKECDRIQVIARELRRCGARVEELADGLRIDGGHALHGAVIDPEHDHRVAMAFALLGLFVPSVCIGTPDCTNKSYPTFWQDLAIVQGSLRCISVVGMRGAGKTEFARALAENTGREWRDTDAMFVAKHGPIAAFVAEHGWQHFREIEAQMVAAAIAPGCIVSTGGGAIENAATRELLHRHSVPVWLDAAADLIRARLRIDSDRPSITGAPVGDEVNSVLVQRRPLYEQVAAMRIDAALPSAAQVALALRMLGAPCRMPYTRA